MATGKPKPAEQFLKHRDMLEQFVHMLVRDPSDAEEIFQETALAILEGRAKVPDRVEDFPRWSRGVARNIMRNFWRSRRRGKLLYDQSLLDAVEEAYAEADDDAELWMARRHALDTCVDKADPGSRELIDLSYGQCLSSAQIAAKLKKSAVAVRKALSRIRGALETCIEDTLASESTNAAGR